MVFIAVLSYLGGDKGTAGPVSRIESGGKTMHGMRQLPMVRNALWE